MRNNNQSFQKNFRSNKDSVNVLSRIISFIWFGIVIWFIFLIIYCWKFGVFSNEKIKIYKEELDYVINQTEYNIRGGISHIRLGVPIAHLPGMEENINNNNNIHITKPFDPDEVHIIFSTDCSTYQDWQTLVVFFSAKQVGQKGEITRIASGCNDDKKNELTNLYRKLYPQYHVHFTPDFKKDSKTQKSCK
jgi:hypothetical protein